VSEVAGSAQHAAASATPDLRPDLDRIAQASSDLRARIDALGTHGSKADGPGPSPVAVLDPSVRHGLRTPMNGLLGFLDLCLDAARGAWLQPRLLDLQEQARHILAILDAVIG